MTYTADLHQKCSEIFKNWLEDSMRQNVDSMAKLATTGLKHIIHDQDLIFQIKQEPKYNRLAMRFVLENNGVEGDPINSYGGGAAVIISFVLRVAVMARMKMANLHILDESMLALSNSYVPSAAAFMRRLSEETGINILLVTHNPEFINHSHVSYEGRKEGSGIGHLRLRKLHHQPIESSP
jgi:DNA repair exonuclease SbcCD ATPase subunit